jgi:GAF domain-containing protein
MQAITEEIRHELDFTTLLALLVRRAAELVRSMSGVVYLWDRASQVLVPQAWYGLGEWLYGIRFGLERARHTHLPEEVLLGVPALSGQQPFHLTPDAQSLLDGFVAQAAVAIRNASMIIASRYRAAHQQRLQRFLATGRC